MSKSKASGRSSATGRFITVNKAYVKKQASEAVGTFFAPVSGAWKATKKAGGSTKETVGAGANRR